MELVKEAFPEFEKPSLAVDAVILRVKDTEDKVDNRQISNKQLQILLVKKPDEDKWHLPGTMVRLGETFNDAIKRIVDTESNISFEQLYTVDDPLRDDRGHIVTTVHIGMSDGLSKVVITNDYESRWFWISRASDNRYFIDTTVGFTQEELKYDHNKIIEDTLKRLKGKLLYTDVGFNFIGNKFTIKELENTFNAINERTIPGFRRIISNKVIGTGELSDGKAFRPAELFIKKE